MLPPPLTTPFRIGNVTVSNRVLLAPLAGIGNWFVRLQARRHGAGLAVSEMVSSIALAMGNRRTRTEMLRIHPAEHPVSVQLFGGDPAAMREAAWIVADAGADVIDLNLGCPVPKVCRTGAGAALLDEPDRAIELARAAAVPGLPVTAKLRSGIAPGDRSGFDLALRLAAEAGVKRHVLTHKHTDLKDLFNARVRAQDSVPARETVLTLPPGRWLDEITGRTHEGTAFLAEVWSVLPVALLTRLSP